MRGGPDPRGGPKEPGPPADHCLSSYRRLTMPHAGPSYNLDKALTARIVQERLKTRETILNCARG